MILGYGNGQYGVPYRCADPRRDILVIARPNQTTLSEESLLKLPPFLKLANASLYIRLYQEQNTSCETLFVAYVLLYKSRKGPMYTNIWTFC